TTAEQVARLVQAVDVPVNVTAHPLNGHGAGDFAALAALGVRRVTFGPLWQMWLAARSADKLAAWRKV
ncbi:MAG: isocitrate lyase/phosphoenolpyruvate mutase family protein, partial [Actinomycetales bacterium]|nr:isocitrate lyase/phosphoenolpyruvate mutase family protein [Actinomycetales bacterium]